MRKTQLRAIVKADNARRARRSQAELIELAERYYAPNEITAPDGVDPYHYSRSITGAPSPGNRNVKVTENCFLTHYGITSDGETIKRRIGYQTVGGPVKVTKDGTTNIVQPESFRRPRKTTKSHTVANERQAARLALLASCGNATELASGDA